MDGGDELVNGASKPRNRGPVIAHPGFASAHPGLRNLRNSEPREDGAPRLWVVGALHGRFRIKGDHERLLVGCERLLRAQLVGLWIRGRIERFRSPLAALAVVHALMGLAALETLPAYHFAFDAMQAAMARLARSDLGYLG